MGQQSHINRLLRVCENLPNPEDGCAVVYVPNDILRDLAIHLLEELGKDAEVVVSPETRWAFSHVKYWNPSWKNEDV